MDRRNFIGAAAGALGFGVIAKSATKDEAGRPRPLDGVGIFRFPDIMVGEDGKEVPAHDLAQACAKEIGKGTVLCLPASRDEQGNYLWGFVVVGVPDQVVVERST